MKITLLEKGKQKQSKTIHRQGDDPADCHIQEVQVQQGTDLGTFEMH